MMKAKLLTVASLAVGIGAGCNAEVTAPVGPEKMAVGNTVEPDLPTEHPAVTALTVRSRGPRRMSVEQLELSLDALGNLPFGSVKLPPDLAITLGRPDYVRTTEETLEPSPLFMKFMMDLGGILCANFGDSDPTRPAQERVFTRYTERDQNLEYMLLRFTGIEGEDAAPYLERLRRVYDTAAPAARQLSGYEAACLALFTSPEFLLY